MLKPMHMPPRFKKAPGTGEIFLPGYGRVREDDILIGESFAQHVPHHLVPITDEDDVVVSPVAFAPVPDLVEDPPSTERPGEVEIPKPLPMVSNVIVSVDGDLKERRAEVIIKGTLASAEVVAEEAPEKSLMGELDEEEPTPVAKRGPGRPKGSGKKA